MNTSSQLRFLISILLVFSASCSGQSLDTCSPLKFDPLQLKDSTLDASWSTVTIGSLLLAPMMVGDRYILDNGPVLHTSSGSKQLTYRVIGRSELSRTGTSKKPSQYFIDVFASPSGMECALANSFESADKKYKVNHPSMDVTLFFIDGAYKAFLVSDPFDFALEVALSGFSLDEVRTILVNIKSK